MVKGIADDLAKARDRRGRMETCSDADELYEVQKSKTEDWLAGSPDLYRYSERTTAEKQEFITGTQPNALWSCGAPQRNRSSGIRP